MRTNVDMVDSSARALDGSEELGMHAIEFSPTDAPARDASLVGDDKNFESQPGQRGHGLGRSREQPELGKGADVFALGRFVIDHAVAIKQDRSHRSTGFQ